MCLFPIPNTDYNGVAYRNGVTEFDCGSCPECLSKRASSWALRCVYESKLHKHSCMITLTYDNYERDKSGNIVRDCKTGEPVELPVDPSLHVSVRDIQLFIKRLRSYYKCVSIKYLCCSEYGSRTHRAHYHLLIFGVDFPDRHFYKMSKRGNPIYMSDTLSKLWNNGICTIDSVHIRSACARYCTKYCAKSRSDDTFMLASQGIGLSSLLLDFNGKSYFIDGKEYTVPRIVWQHYISNKYSDRKGFFDYRYVNKTVETLNNGRYDESVLLRNNYRYLRNSDPLYLSYLEYWKHKAEQFKAVQLPVLDRIIQLDDRKYHNYKIACLKSFYSSEDIGFRVLSPLCLSGKSFYLRSLENLHRCIGIRVRNIESFLPYNLRLFLANKIVNKSHLPNCSRLYTASDSDFISVDDSLPYLPSCITEFGFLPISCSDSLYKIF